MIAMKNHVPDLSGLNAAEREALAMLASGHTAKSIANLTGRSEGAVNERLRDARRKTGVGSSRELARIMREQENRDDEIGVARSAAMDATPYRPAGGHDRRLPKAFIMMSILTAAGSISLAFYTAQPSQIAASQDTQIDPIVGSVSSTLPALSQRFANEDRDPAWATRSEASLAAAYRKMGGLDDGPQIRCKSTLCEVAGSSRNGNESALNRTMRALQDRKLLSNLATTSLYIVGQGFVDADKSHIRFIAYWSSNAPK
jgi:DNA-binding CsgD family transcriptional regulator